MNRSTGEVEGIKRRVRLFAHRLIEEFMLAANEAVARFLTEKGTPFPYRIHPAPDPDRLSTLFRTLASTDLAQSDLLTLKRGETPSPSRLRDILVQANGTPQEYLVGRLVLRSMMQARYSPEAGELSGWLPLLLPLHVAHPALCRPAGASGAVLYARRDAGADPRRAQAAYGGGPVQRP